MADQTTETATPAADGSPQKGSEFSKPTGTGDDALWQKHFGKDSKEPKGDGKPSAKPKNSSTDKSEKSSASSSERPKDSDKSPSKSTHDATAGKSEKPSTPKDTKPAKEAKDSIESTGRKTADETPADPEAPSKKAKDLYEQAKKTEDRREARKLYKRAMTEAFGEVPEEFDDRKYAAVRTERAAAKSALDEQAKKNEGRIQEAAGRLKPAIFVMRQLEDAKLGDKLTVPMVERAIHVMRALRGLEDGDFTQLAEVVSRASGVDADEAMKRFVRGVKVSPEGRAARAQAEQSQRDNLALKERLGQLERQLQERETTQTEAQKKVERERAQVETRQRWIDDISTELDGHAALKLPRGAERVLAYLIRTANPQTKAPRYSFEEAGNRIVAAEKKRLLGARHLLDEGSDIPAPAETTRRLSSVARTETAESGIRKESGEAAFERIFEARMGSGRRR